jgi:hypothetical protein
MVDFREIEARIQVRAHELWEREGSPEGRADAHWDMAKEQIAIEDNQQNLTLPNPVAEGHEYADGTEGAEPLLAVENLGEFPNALTDQGEDRAYPMSREQLKHAAE